VQIFIDKKQLEDLENISYLHSITRDERCTRRIKSRISMEKSAFNRKKNIFTSKLELILRKKLVKCCTWKIVSYGAENGTLRKVYQKYVGSFETWRRKSVAPIVWEMRKYFTV
jgi:hypothetical protein